MICQTINKSSLSHHWKENIDLLSFPNGVNLTVPAHTQPKLFGTEYAGVEGIQIGKTHLNIIYDYL